MSILGRFKFIVKQTPFIYPIRIIGSCKRWIDKENSRYIEYKGHRQDWYKPIETEEFHVNALPNTLGINKKNKFNRNIIYKTNSSTLFFINNAYLYKEKGLVFNKKHELFQEFSHHFSIDSLKQYILTRPFYTLSKSVKKLNGVGATLISPESVNYYHWIFDVLPRIKLYNAVKDHIDYFCVNKNIPKKYLDSLAYFGIPPEKILLIDPNQKIQFDHLYVTSLIGSEGRSPKWAINFLRENFRISSDQNIPRPNTRIYFQRSGDLRKVVNESSIIDTLKLLNFEIIDPTHLTFFEQIELMQRAEIVVSAHGAALSNLLFCPPGTTVIEVFSPDYFRTDCFYTLANQIGMSYWYIEGIKKDGYGWGDIYIDNELLQQTVLKILNV